MNVGPTQFSATVPDLQRSVKPLRAPESRPPDVQVQAKPTPKIEKAATPAPIAQDVVKLQWDSAVHLRIYQFVNQSGTLVLQIPSEQVLNVARGIQEAFQKETLQRETLQLETKQPPVPLIPDEGEKSNGS